MKKVAVLLIFLILLPLLARSNSAPVSLSGIDGADVAVVKNNQILLVREVINIDCAWTTYTVQADFWFKNTTRQKQDVQFGFPVDYSQFGQDWLDDWDDVVQTSRNSFKVVWQGKPIKYVLGKVQHQEASQENRQWIYWISTFAPEEEVHHRISYTFPTSRNSGGSKGEPPHASLRYILKTGAAWQGPIESSTVIIHYDHPIPAFFGSSEGEVWKPEPLDLTFSPQGARWDKEQKTVTWTFKNYVPREDIQFEWRLRDNDGWFKGVLFSMIGLVTVITLGIAIAIIFSLNRNQKRKRRDRAEQLVSPPTPSLPE